MAQFIAKFWEKLTLEDIFLLYERELITKEVVRDLFGFDNNNKSLVLSIIPVWEETIFRTINNNDQLQNKLSEKIIYVEKMYKNKFIDEKEKTVLINELLKQCNFIVENDLVYGLDMSKAK